MTVLASVLLLFDDWFGQQEGAKASTLASRLQRFDTATQCSILGIVQRTSIRYNRLAEHQLTNAGPALPTFLESRSSCLDRPTHPLSIHRRRVLHLVVAWSAHTQRSKSLTENLD